MTPRQIHVLLQSGKKNGSKVSPANKSHQTRLPSSLRPSRPVLLARSVILPRRRCRHCFPHFLPLLWGWRAGGHSPRRRQSPRLVLFHRRRQSSGSGGFINEISLSPIHLPGSSVDLSVNPSQLRSSRRRVSLFVPFRLRRESSPSRVHLAVPFLRPPAHLLALAALCSCWVLSSVDFTAPVH